MRGAPALRGPRRAGVPARARPCLSAPAARPARPRPRRARARASSLRSGSRPAGSLLEPGGDVDRVAGREPLLGSGHDLARIEPNPCRKVSSGNASRISTAARQARRASSSCTWGTPKTAMTASPMNFSTVPRATRRSLHALEVAGEQGAQRLGSVDSPSAVEPVMSQKRTVTVLRCSREGEATSSGAAQFPQNLASSRFSAPHAAQRRMRPA